VITALIVVCVLIIISSIIVGMFFASIGRDLDQMDEERKKELRDWEEDL
jgi:hypothetical protein